MLEGGCYCGKVRYQVEGDPVYAAICNCRDCRRHSGAPMVCWSAFRHEQPGLTDIQTGTLDDPEQLPPAIQVQTAERLGWMKGISGLPVFERYPAP